jgi:predicted ArsR family transcriptional regulator
MLEVFLAWISSMLSNFGIRAKMLSDRNGKALEILGCPWETEARENPIFCAICRSMIISSFGWTCLKGEAKQTASHSDGAEKCRFEFRVEPGERKSR